MRLPGSLSTLVAAPLALLASVLGAVGSTAHAGQPVLRAELLVDGLNHPVFITHAPGDADRLFVVERAGRIRVIENDQLLPAPFLDIEVITDFKGGLLGLAFHPEYQTNGYFYVNYLSDGRGGQFPWMTVIERYEVTDNPSIADPASAHTVIEIGQPDAFHNGGWISFSPVNGLLYISMGDGGFAGSGQVRAQDVTAQLLGKLLRIDVDADDFPKDGGRNYAIPPDNPYIGVKGDDEIFALGLRNPWRCGFDRNTGDLWLGDVGAGNREEVDLIPADSPGGENFGWGCMEGTNCNGQYCECNSPDLTLPVHDYNHLTGNVITGGVVYRGCEIPELAGAYIFGDFGFNRIWTFRYESGRVTDFIERTEQLDPPGSPFIGSITCFGEDLSGELYVCDYNGGEVFRILPQLAIPGDIDGDGLVGPSDLALILGLWGPCPGECPADINQDGLVNPADLAIVLGNWG